MDCKTKKSLGPTLELHIGQLIGRVEIKVFPDISDKEQQISLEKLDLHLEKRCLETLSRSIQTALQGFAQEE